MKKSRHHKRKLFYFLFCFLWLCFCFSAAQPAFAYDDVINAGFFKYSGYYQIAENGDRYGYGYDFLQELSTYTNWKFNLVGYNNSFSEMLHMLQNGEIDLLMPVYKTPEREKNFAFSEQHVGVSYTMLTVKAGNEKYTTGNYQRLKGIRVGILQESELEDGLAQFAKEKGFSYQAVYFSSSQEMIKALQEGTQIDALLTTSVRTTQNEWIIACFHPQAAYIAVRKENTALLNDINAALEKITIWNSGIQKHLQEQYYTSMNTDSIYFSDEDRRYQTQHQDHVFQILVNPDRKPISWYEDGKMQGIVPELAACIMERAGLQYTFIPVSDRTTYIKQYTEHSIDLCFDAIHDFNQAEKNHYKLSNSFLRLPLTYLMRKDFVGAQHTLAIPEGIESRYLLQSDMIPTPIETVYDTLDKCVAAIEQRKQDAALLCSYTGQDLVYSDVKNELICHTLYEMELPICIAVGEEQDVTLLSLLNKSINSLSQQEINACIAKWTEPQARPFSIIGLFYHKPILIIVSVSTVSAICLFFMILFHCYKQQKLKRFRMHEFERAITYICMTHDDVAEYNIQQKNCRRFILKNGGITQETIAYYPSDTMEGRMHPEDFSRLRHLFTPQALQNLSVHHRQKQFTCRIKDTRDTYLWQEYVLVGTAHNGSAPYTFFAFQRNIDPIKQEEERQRQALQDALDNAEKASTEKSTFLSRISHEIRTPLGAIIGYLDMATEEQTTLPQIQDYMQKSHIAAKHLLNIINHVLDISAIESGHMQIANEDFDLKQLLSSITTMFYEQARKKGITFQTEVGHTTPEWVIGDSLRINQILMNLLSNAIKFTPIGGTVRLTVDQSAVIDSKVHIRFTVRDTGVGMQPEYMQRIWKPFEQEDAGVARKYGGTGLGLSICKNLVSMMNGTIEVQSEVGKGTCFTVLIGFTPSAKNNTAITDSVFSQLRAVIIENTESGYNTIQSILQHCGIKNDVVPCTERGLKRIKSRMESAFSYDLCFIDWDMPNGNSTETVKQLYALCQDKIPTIIAVSCHSHLIEPQAEAAGVHHIVAKPLFQSTISSLLTDLYGAHPSKPDKPTSSFTFDNISILLAEDNDMNREIIVTQLQKAGLKITAAEDGQQAVDAFVQMPPHTYQAILMDIQMPNQNGYEATRMIRASGHPQAKTIPIIAMTADAFTEDVTAALAAGMNDHVSKPIDFERLFQVLKQHIPEVYSQ